MANEETHRQAPNPGPESPPEKLTLAQLAKGLSSIMADLAAGRISPTEGNRRTKRTYAAFLRFHHSRV